MDAVGKALQRLAAAVRGGAAGRAAGAPLSAGEETARLGAGALLNRPGAILVGDAPEMDAAEALWEQLHMADAVQTRVLAPRVGSRAARLLARWLSPRTQRVLLRLSAERGPSAARRAGDAAMAFYRRILIGARRVWYGDSAGRYNTAEIGDATPPIVPRDTGLGENTAAEGDATPTAVLRDIGLGERIAVVGVHGWVPTNRVLQGIVGAQRGTSPRLAAGLADALAAWPPSGASVLGALGPRSRAASRVHLSGAGTVLERVESHAAQIESEYTAALRRADTVLFAAHSQGAPVAALLAERLAKNGVIRRDARIGLLAMAGVFGGPHALVSLGDSWLLRSVEAGGGPAAAELFRLGDSRYHVSQRVRDALSFLLGERRARVVATAAWMDPLVPLHSATLSGRLCGASDSGIFAHTGIWRAVHVDAGAAADAECAVPALLARIAVVLAGAGAPGGVSLLALLSDALYASLVSGSGRADASEASAAANPHSGIYEDAANYRVLLHWMSQARPDYGALSGDGSIGSQQSHLESGADGLEERPSAALSPADNPHELAYVLRGIAENSVLFRAVRGDCAALCRVFPAWAPARRPLRLLRLQVEPFVRHLQRSLRT